MATGSAPPKEYDYVIFLTKTTGGMRFHYVMIDSTNHVLAPQINVVIWARLKDLVDFTACVFKNCLYVMGGKDKTTGKYSKDVHKYDPKLARWMQCASMKRTRARFRAVTNYGKIYVLGGAISDKTMTDTVESYEPLMDEWSVENILMPSARKDHACVVHNEAIYVLGGASPTQSTNNNVWIMKRCFPDPSNPTKCTYTWENLPQEIHPTMKHQLSQHSTVLCNGKLYIIGGVCHGLSLDGHTFLHNSLVATFPIQEPTQGAPQSDTSAPSDVPKQLIATANMIEGYKFPLVVPDEFGLESDLEEAERREKEKEQRNQKRQKRSKRDIRNKEEPELDTGEEKEKKRPKTHWLRSLAVMPGARCGSGSLVVGNKIYVIGGHRLEAEEGTSIRDVDYFHTRKKTWSSCFSLPEGDYRDVQCVVLAIPTGNRDFKPMKYSDCKWVMW